VPALFILTSDFFILFCKSEDRTEGQPGAVGSLRYGQSGYAIQQNSQQCLK
jgi:hypothetical protein